MKTDKLADVLENFTWAFKTPVINYFFISIAGITFREGVEKWCSIVLWSWTSCISIHHPFYTFAGPAENSISWSPSSNPPTENIGLLMSFSWEDWMGWLEHFSKRWFEDKKMPWRSEKTFKQCEWQHIYFLSLLVQFLLLAVREWKRGFRGNFPGQENSRKGWIIMGQQKFLIKW